MKKIFKGNDFTAVFSTKNGYISLTGTVDGVSGAIGDRLAEINSEFALMAAMHLSNSETGEPMHFIENAAYHLSGFDRKALSRHIRSQDIANKMVNEFNLLLENNEKLENKFKKIDLARKVVRNNAPILRNRFKAELITLKRQVEEMSSDMIEDLGLTKEDFGNPDQAEALKNHLGCDYDAISESYDENILKAQGAEYLVIEEDTANELWDQSLENYLEDCVLCEMDTISQQYFDRERWKRDARMDGRGHSLAGYDGHEYSEGEFFIYRIN